MSSSKRLKSSLNLDDFLSQQGIRPDQWDLLMFGDGSGQGWKDAGGFCCFIVDGRRGRRTHVIGGRNRTTVNRMELSAYTESLSLHLYEVLGGTVMDPPYRTWIFTDSEYTANVGSGKYARKANPDLWAIVDWYRQRGYDFNWRWVVRNSTPFHELADRLAGEARKAVNALAIEENELFDVMPAVNMVRAEFKVELVPCPVCSTPLLPTEPECPACGHQLQITEE